MAGKAIPRLLPALLSLTLGACGEVATLPESAGFGHTPQLPAPLTHLLPTFHLARASGWPAGQAPRPAPGLAVTAYAEHFAHPRWLYVLPNGDVLVAETAAPQRSGGSLADWFQKQVMKFVGAAVPSAERITLLRGVDGQGRARTRTVFLQGLHSPFGMALVGNFLYVANTDALLRFPYEPGATAITAPGVEVLALPAGPRNHHWTRGLIASPDGRRLYVTVGSNSNVAENGLASEAGRAAIHEFDIASGRARIFASGLRNPNGLAWEPVSGALWTTVNERDELGSDLVPDYFTHVQDGGFYGWPWRYYGQHVDTRVSPPASGQIASVITPDFALGAHTASLGLAFYTARLLPARYAGGAFIGQHGSWNRRPFSGYKVIFVPFADAHPSGPVEEVLGGFLSAEGEAYGRPVGVAVDATGALLVADDVGNVVWRVTPAGP